MQLIAVDSVGTRQPTGTTLRALVHAIRPHQWVKNVLLFAPLVASHKLFDPSRLISCVWGFCAFSLCASAVYVVNDIFDVEADRLHPRKRHRPFASGALGIRTGVLLAAAMACGSVLLSVIVLTPAFSLILIVYLFATTIYSTRLKVEPVLDVFTLAGLYVLRVYAGGVAAGIQLSSWLIAFALFIFLSLAFVKRYGELVANGHAPGRGYTAADASWMQAVGISSGYMAGLVLALYISAPDVTVLYRRPRALWLLCPVVLFWITRMWLRAGRGAMHDDPLVAALNDRVAYACAVVAAFVLLAAL